MDVKGSVRKYIAQTMALVGREVEDNSSLLGQGIIDSAGVLELVAFVEDAFGIRVGDNELAPENFDSLNRIQSYLDRKLTLARG